MTKPDTKTFVEPTTTRTLQEWTPNLLRAARAMADAGSLELASDFCESAMSDDRVAAALSTRCNGLLSLPLAFDAVRGTKRLVKALEAGEDWWAAYPSTDLSLLMRWGITLGVGLGQHVWTDRGSTINRIVPRIKVWHPRNLRRDVQRRAWQVRVDGGRYVDIEPGDGTWVLYTPYGEAEPWKRGAWRSIANWFLLKTYAIQDWGYYSGKNAGGHHVLQTPENWSKEKRKELAADIFAAQANSAIALPAGCTYELIESEANTYQTFEAQKNAADVGMSIAILGQNLSTEVSGPVATGATLHGRVLQVFIDADAETLATCIHDQSLVWWAEFNFGSRDLAPWPVWDTKPPEDKKQSAEVGKTRAETGKTLASLGVATVNEVRVAAGLEPLKEGGDELVKPAPPPQPTTPNEGKGIHLRSGRVVTRASGIVQGQLYADRVADHARARAAGVLEGDLDDVLEAVADASSYEDLRTRLAKAFKGMSPDELAQLTEKALILAELGGRHAQNEDA